MSYPKTYSSVGKAPNALHQSSRLESVDITYLAFLENVGETARAKQAPDEISDVPASVGQCLHPSHRTAADAALYLGAEGAHSPSGLVLAGSWRCTAGCQCLPAGYERTPAGKRPAGWQAAS